MKQNVFTKISRIRLLIKFIRRFHQTVESISERLFSRVFQTPLESRLYTFLDMGDSNHRHFILSENNQLLPACLARKENETKEPYHAIKLRSNLFISHAALRNHPWIEGCYFIRGKFSYDRRRTESAAYNNIITDSLGYAMNTHWSIGCLNTTKEPINPQIANFYD